MIHSLVKCVFWLGLMFWHWTYAQQSDYFITRTDTLRVNGVKLVSGLPSRYAYECLHLVGTDTVTYGPERLLEYGFASGKSFVGRQIEVDGEQQWWFLDVEEQGPVSFYSLKLDERRYFIESAELGLEELTPDNAAALLQRYFTRDSCRSSLNLPSEGGQLSPRRTASLIADFNQCGSLSVFSSLVKKYAPKTYAPRLRWGLYGGLHQSFLSFGVVQSPELAWTQGARSSSSFNPTVGAFVQFPVGQSGLYLRPEVNWQYQGYMSVSNYTTDLNLAYQVIGVPLLLRYELGQLFLKPYVQTGLLLRRMVALSSDYYVYRRFVEPQELGLAGPPRTIVQTVEKPFDETLLAGTQLYVPWGVGIQVELSSRRGVFAELRGVLPLSSESAITAHSINYNIGLSF